MQDWEPSLAFSTVTGSVPRCQSHVPYPSGPLVTQSTGIKRQTGKCLPLFLGPRWRYLAQVSSPDIKNCFWRPDILRGIPGIKTADSDSSGIGTSWFCEHAPHPHILPWESSPRKMAICSFCRIHETSFKFLGGNLSRVVALERLFHGKWGERAWDRQELSSREAGLSPCHRMTVCMSLSQQGSSSCCFPLSLFEDCLPPSPQAPIHDSHPLLQRALSFWVPEQTLSDTWGRGGNVSLAHKRGGDFHEAWFPWISFFSSGGKGGNFKSSCHLIVEKGSFPTSHEAIQVFPFLGMCCHRSVDWEALALLLGTPRLQQEVCSFHSLNIIQVLIIKAGWNSMSRIDDSTPLTAGSSLARSARQTHTMHAASRSHQPSFQMRHTHILPHSTALDFR